MTRLGTGPRSAQAAPPDGCPNCLRRDITPWRTIRTDLAVVGWYRCPCGVRWRTHWNPQALPDRSDQEDATVKLPDSPPAEVTR